MPFYLIKLITYVLYKDIYRICFVEWLGITFVGNRFYTFELKIDQIDFYRTICQLSPQVPSPFFCLKQ